jgi:cytidyltransferase-like protein
MGISKYQIMKQPKEEARIKNYKFVKESREEGLEWVRIEALKYLDLKRPVVLLNGCFDLLHSGHMKVIFHARKHGKTLICALDSDDMVAAKKPGHPVLSWIERAVSLGFMPIDYLVEVNSDEEFKQLVKVVKPDLRVRGAEYKDKPSRTPGIPSLLVHDSGLRTSAIIERIVNASKRTVNEGESNPRGPRR